MPHFKYIMRMGAILKWMRIPRIIRIWDLNSIDPTRICKCWASVEYCTHRIAHTNSKMCGESVCQSSILNKYEMHRTYLAQSSSVIGRVVHSVTVFRICVIDFNIKLNYLWTEKTGITPAFQPSAGAAVTRYAGRSQRIFCIIKTRPMHVVIDFACFPVAVRRARVLCQVMAQRWIRFMYILYDGVHWER